MPGPFIAQRRGVVTQVLSKYGGAVMPFQIRMEGIGIGSNIDTAPAIVTQAAVIQDGNFQFLHTINEAIYVYVFGDRVGELRVSGVAFSGSCNSRPGVSNVTGMNYVLDTYTLNRLSQSPRPLLINFGDVPFRGFLVGMQLDVTDPESNLGQWAFRFRTFPGKT